MRNIAKCKLCNDIIESFNDTDHVFCKCGEISVNNGQAMRCTANDFRNFLRVDDKGNEIAVTVKDSDHLEQQLTRDDLLKTLDLQIKTIESLPDKAKLSPLNHYDLLSVMIWISSFFKLRD